MTIKKLTLGGSADESLVVPTHKAWKILYGHIAIVTNALPAENREFKISFFDENDVELFDIHAGSVQAQSATKHYTIVPSGDYRETTFVGTTEGDLFVPLPEHSILLGGWYLRVHDAESKSASDAITGTVVVAETVASGIERLL